MQTQTTTLIAAGLATTGWLYAAHRARSLSRKQHTINVLLQASFNKDFRESLRTIAPYLKQGTAPDDLDTEENAELRGHFRFVMNHYEFVAAGVRNGDLAERLIIDSERGTILAVFAACSSYIYKMRTDRSRMTLYEHLEWLNSRWLTSPPKWYQKCYEWCMSRPHCGARHDPHKK